MNLERTKEKRSESVEGREKLATITKNKIIKFKLEDYTYKSTNKSFVAAGFRCKEERKRRGRKKDESYMYHES